MCPTGLQADRETSEGVRDKKTSCSILLGVSRVIRVAAANALTGLDPESHVAVRLSCPSTTGTLARFPCWKPHPASVRASPQKTTPHPRNFRRTPLSLVHVIVPQKGGTTQNVCPPDTFIPPPSNPELSQPVSKFLVISAITILEHRYRQRQPASITFTGRANLARRRIRPGPTKNPGGPTEIYRPAGRRPRHRP